MGTTHSDPYGSYWIVPVSGWAGRPVVATEYVLPVKFLTLPAIAAATSALTNAVGIDDFPNAQYLFFDRDRVRGDGTQKVFGRSGNTRQQVGDFSSGTGFRRAYRFRCRKQAADGILEGVILRE